MDSVNTSMQGTSIQNAQTMGWRAARLKRAVVPPSGLAEFLHSIRRAGGISSCFALSTCHQAEVYAQVGAFHSVAPTAAALRTKAARVVEAEIARLARRLDQLDPAAYEEIVSALHRVAGKLLHAPTVRVKELAGSPGAARVRRRCASYSILTTPRCRRWPPPTPTSQNG